MHQAQHLSSTSKKPRATFPLIQVKLIIYLQTHFAVSDNYFQLVQQALAGSSSQLDMLDITIPASSSLLLAPSGSNFDEINLKQVNIPPPADSTSITIG